MDGSATKCVFSNAAGCSGIGEAWMNGLNGIQFFCMKNPDDNYILD